MASGQLKDLNLTLSGPFDCFAGGKRGNPLRVLANPVPHLAAVRPAAVMKEVTGVSNGWLAERLQMGRPASVSQFVRRLRLAGGLNRCDVSGALSQVKS
jgi:hypothetical protein